MLKVVFSIDCDSCREPFETAAVCCDFEPFVWSSFALDLANYVQANGWGFDEDTQRFLCENCYAADTGLALTLDVSEAALAFHSLSSYMVMKGFEVSDNTRKLHERLKEYIS